ncbi:MAG: BMP family protein [Nitrospinota bacterium]
MMKRFLVGLSAAIVVAAMFLGGGQAWAQKKVAWVLPGTINDEGFNQSGYEALMRLKKMGVKVAFSENTPPPKFVSTLSNYAAQGYDVVVGQGFEFGDPIMKVAPKYPKTKFINIVGIVNRDGKQKNVRVLQIASNESAYVAGALAGLMTKTNRLGVIGGFPFPSIVSQLEAFRLGARAVNPKSKTNIVYISSFEDLSKAKEAALAQISAGADVLYHVADHAGLAIVRAAQEKGVMAIGNGLDQYAVAPKAIIVTQLVDYGGTAVDTITNYFKNGTFDPGLHVYPMRVGGVTDLSAFHNNVPKSIQERVLKIRDDIIKGKIKVPFIPKPQKN